MLRPNIERIEAYQPGEQPPPAQGFIKLNTNENPYPPSPRAVNAIRAEARSSIRLYPDPLATPVREAAARLYGLSPESVLVGNGSDDLLTIIMRSFVDPGETICWATPSYTLYRTLAEIQDARVLEVPFPEDYSLPPGLAEANAKVTFLANPNSPSGTLVPPDQVERLARACKGLLVVDEAYADFASANSLALAGRLPNVVVLRSLSKSFSLCGVRCGIALAHPELIKGMAKVKDSYNVNRLAIVAASAALEDVQYMRRNVRRIVSTRERLKAQLETMGFACYPSESNFVLARVPHGGDAKQVYQRLKGRRILVRYFDRPRLNDCVRITVGTDGEVDALLEALRSELLS